MNPSFGQDQEEDEYKDAVVELRQTVDNDHNQNDDLQSVNARIEDSQRSDSRGKSCRLSKKSYKLEPFDK